MTAKLLRCVCLLGVAGGIGTALTGCGGSASTSATARTAGGPLPITKARAAAYAHAVNLRAADLPAMSITSPERARVKPNAEDRALARCAGAVSPDRAVAAIKSASFKGAAEGEFEEIKSSVEVMPTAKLAAESLASIRTARGFACLKRMLPAVLLKAGKTSTAQFGAPTVSRLRTPFVGAADSVGIEVTTNVSGGRLGRARIPVHLEIVGFVVGAAEINLTTFGLPAAVPEEVEQRLEALLYSRATAHTL